MREAQVSSTSLDHGSKLRVSSPKALVNSAMLIFTQSYIMPVSSLVVRASDSRPEGLGSMLDVTKYPPSAHGFTCRNCGGGDRGRVAIYRPFGEVSLSLNRTVTCMVLKAKDRRTSCPCHDKFPGPRSDYVRQVVALKVTHIPTDDRDPMSPALPRDRTQWLWLHCNVFYLFTSGVTENVRILPENQVLSLIFYKLGKYAFSAVQDGLFICYKQSLDNVHYVAFSQRSSSPRLIEDETFNDSDNINNLINYEDEQEARFFKSG
ncbi:uncharacterized protein TNCV_2312451 [Trichonephila clavipes]|nr:uncharacterized protein TNCV_2312451 [Trichonephila clavipes]